jgi:NADH:ubiquinone reductase (H+-translocating)
MRQNEHRVVIVGAGFGGLFATKALRSAPASVTLINGTTYHLFEPLLYQVAAGILSEGEVAPPIREILRHRNLDVRLGWVAGVDVEGRTVLVSAPDGRERRVPYDSLVVAAGARNSYFGNERFAEHAPSLKNIDDALEVRSRIFHAFEMAELEEDAEARRQWLTFVIIGAGPTGVELAGQIAELAHRSLKGQYHRADLAETRVVLLDAADRVLPAFDRPLSASALRQLTRMGVEVRLATRVVDVDAGGVELEGGDRIEAHTKIWAAGVAAPPLARRIAEATGAETDRAGRIRVGPDLTVPGHPEIFVVGDMAATDLPGVAQVAMQGGRYAARVIAGRLAGRPTTSPFRYFDKGNMATIGRFSAVANVGKLHFSGLLGWLMWLGVHLFYLIGFKNKVTTLLHWVVSFLGRDRSERIATAQQIDARNALRRRDAA